MLDFGAAVIRKDVAASCITMQYKMRGRDCKEHDQVCETIYDPVTHMQ